MNNYKEYRITIPVPIEDGFDWAKEKVIIFQIEDSVNTPHSALIEQYTNLLQEPRFKNAFYPKGIATVVVRINLWSVYITDSRGSIIYDRLIHF